MEADLSGRVPERDATLTRRRLLLRAAALAAGGAAVGVGVDRALGGPKPLAPVALGDQPAGPARAPVRVGCDAGA